MTLKVTPHELCSHPRPTLIKEGAELSKKNGGRTWARTKDPLIKSQLLYQLSYASVLNPYVGAKLRREVPHADPDSGLALDLARLALMASA